MYIRGLKKEIVYLIITLFIFLISLVCIFLFLLDRSKEDKEKKEFRREIKEILKDVKNNCEKEILDGRAHTSLYVIENGKVDLIGKEYKVIKSGMISVNSKCELTHRFYTNKYMSYKNNDSFLILDEKKYNKCMFDGKIEIGNIITCGQEEFYIVDISSSTISVLSKYNIDPLSNTQDSKDTHAIAFDYINNRKVNLNSYCLSSLYGCNIYEKVDGVFKNGEFEGTIKEDSTIKPYVDSYALKLNLGENLLSASLITIDILEKLGCQTNENTCLNSKYSFIYDTSYWTKSIFNGSPSIVWHVLNDGVFSGCYANYDNFSGIRPYLVLKKDILETSN